MFMKRKSAVTAMIVLFVCVAVYLNWSYTQSGTDELLETAGKTKILGEAALVNQEDSAEKKDGNYFDEARLEKQKSRDSALNILKETSEKEDVSQESRDQAAASMEQIAVSGVCENRIETLVKAKGFEDCVALMNEDSVNVIVKAPADGLTAGDIAKIKDIVMAETDLDASKIKVVEIK
ncbi:MAG: SpoIIIAH-like family protein [Ruminococcaceae bacterium]|nr:SpoIIIAH-like family protein [Oscillospiraceae bacterium]